MGWMGQIFPEPDPEGDSFKHRFLLVVKRTEFNSKLMSVIQTIRGIRNRADRATEPSQLALTQIFDDGLADGLCLEVAALLHLRRGGGWRTEEDR